MSPAGPQQPGQKAGNSPKRAFSKLRQLPGFTAAAVVFVLIVLLGGGGAAIAKWNQSATVAIAITAGAAPTTSPAPSPTPSPTPTPSPSATSTPPPASPGNIVAKPVIATRPQLIDPETAKCDAPGNSGNYTLVWAGDSSGSTSYIVSLGVSNNNYGSPQEKTVSTNRASFILDNKEAAYGSYILRILPMKGDVAGDPIYRTVQHGKWTQQCVYASPDNRSPLGPFSVNAVRASPEKTNNVLNVSWTTLAAGTKYLVSIATTDTPASFGAEFATTTSGATLTFPPYVVDKSGNPTNDGAYSTEYLLRVLPVNGAQVGDPVYKKVFYYANDFRVGNFQFQY